MIMYTNILLVIFLIICIYGLYNKHFNAICKSKKRLDGKTCLVTGGTSGIGLEIALDFAMRGARVIIACPFKGEGEQAKNAIVEQSKNDNVVFKNLDLGSFKSVRQFAGDIIQNEDRLDILVNNAGVGIPNEVTDDGINIIMQVNYFGPFLLTILLLPLLKKTGKPSTPSRIVNTTSIFHPLGTFVKELNPAPTWYLKRICVYGNSKMSLVLFSHELTKLLSGYNVVINDADPGSVGTRIFHSSGFIFGSFLRIMVFILSKTPFEGAQAAIYAAVDCEAGKVSGKYFKECSLQASARFDGFTAKSVWNESVAIVRLREKELEECLK